MIPKLYKLGSLLATDPGSTAEWTGKWHSGSLRLFSFFPHFNCDERIGVAALPDPRKPDSDDYYKLFEMDRQTFDKTALKKAYYRLAKSITRTRIREQGSRKKFKEITHAFEVLNDDKKRQVYDVHGEAGIQGGYDSDQGFNPQDIFER